MDGENIEIELEFDQVDSCFWLEVIRDCTEFVIWVLKWSVIGRTNGVESELIGIR